MNDKSKEAPFSNSKGLKVLLVEDNEDDEILILEVFKTYNMQNDVFVVRDGQEALDFIFLEGGRRLPDLILMDLKIPKVPGLEVIKRIRANLVSRGIPVVIFTSSLEERDLIDGYVAGANSYIRKPVDYKAFSLAILQIVNYWLHLNELPPKRIGADL